MSASRCSSSNASRAECACSNSSGRLQNQQVRQRETGGLVHILVVIHDQYAPGLQMCGIPRAIFAVVQEYQIVVRCHHASTSPSACY